MWLLIHTWNNVDSSSQKGPLGVQSNPNNEVLFYIIGHWPKGTDIRPSMSTDVSVVNCPMCMQFKMEAAIFDWPSIYTNDMKLIMFWWASGAASLGFGGFLKISSRNLRVAKIVQSFSLKFSSQMWFLALHIFARYPLKLPKWCRAITLYLQCLHTRLTLGPFYQHG